MRGNARKSPGSSKPLNLLWPVICYAPFRILFLMALPLLSGGMFLASGLIQQAFFNQLDASAIARENHRVVIFWALITLLAANLAVRFVGYVFEYLGNMNFTKIHVSLSSLLQYNLLTQVLRHPLGRATTGSVGEAINTFEEDTDLAISFFSLLGNMLSPIILGITAFVILARVNLLITLLAVLPLTCTSAIVERVRTYISTTRAGRREASSLVIGSIGEIFAAIQPIKIAGAEESIVNYIEVLGDRRRRLEVHDSVLSSMLQALFNGLSNLGIGLILLATAFSIQQGHMFRTGDLVLFTTYLASIVEMVAVIGHARAEYIQTAVSLERLAQLQQGIPIVQLLERKPLNLGSNQPLRFPDSVTRVPQDRLETLEVNDLTYHYPGSECGIKHLNLRLTRGSLTVLTGQIGAGKSTCLRVLLGLLPKESGEIYWNGQCVEDPATFFIPPRSAYTAQVPHLFSDTLKGNILLGLPEAPVNLPQAAYLAVLEHDLMEQESQLDTPVGARGIKLSGGQVQRTATARMLVRDSELVVFDDLSSALDAETEKALWERLLARGGQYTYLAVSHSKALLQKADQIVVLKDGCVEASGDLKTVLATNEEMRRLWLGGAEKADRPIPDELL